MCPLGHRLLPCCGHLGQPWVEVLLGASWGLLGASWEPLGGLLGASWGVLGASGDHLEAVWGPPWEPLGDLWSLSGALEALGEPFGQS